jgi:hypothetical protein
MRTTTTLRVEASSRATASTVAVGYAPAGLFVVALIVNLCGIGWGLPSGNETWANDAIQPGAPLSILHRILVAEPWNSGWFWFKYPLGHVFVLGAAYAPYLVGLRLTGGLSSPTAEYPHGFANPEVAFTTLALLGRGVSAVMGALLAVVAYACLVRSFGRRTALAGGIAVAFCYPIVFYAHTTNVEVPYVFWMMLAFLAAVRLVEGEDRTGWWVLLGGGAAMSFSTKELGAGFFIGIPFAVLLAYRVNGLPLSRWVRGGFVAGASAAVVLVLANNVILNPLGFARRVGFLTQTLAPEVALDYAPYYFPIDLGASKGGAAELQQLAKTGARILQSLGVPTSLLALVGIGVAVRRRPLFGALALACALTYYLFGARAMLSLSMRYVLPLTVMGALLAGIAIGAMLDATASSRLARVAAAAALVWIVIYGADVDHMLLRDGRYEAERWLAERATPGDTVEVYQRATYLPRFPPSLRAVTVPFEERTVEGLAARKPRWVVLSSAGLSGVTVAYSKDWKSEGNDAEEWMPSQIAPGGAVMNYKRKDNVELLTKLTSERLGYRRVESFVAEPWIPRTLIQSLNPEISIYERVGD